MRDCEKCIHYDEYPDFHSPCAACCGKLSTTDNFKKMEKEKIKDNQNV